jgi:transcriptional regulator with XRE-family HTH domain
MANIMIRRCLLQQWLNKRGLTQVDLAHITGLSLTQISEYSTNKRGMSSKNLILISHFLSCHAEELYEWDITE